MIVVYLLTSNDYILLFKQSFSHRFPYLSLDWQWQYDPNNRPYIMTRSRVIFITFFVIILQAHFKCIGTLYAIKHRWNLQSDNNRSTQSWSFLTKAWQFLKYMRRPSFAYLSFVPACLPRIYLHSCIQRVIETGQLSTIIINLFCVRREEIRWPVDVCSIYALPFCFLSFAQYDKSKLLGTG